ncbi:UNKNOWN [Stylonychia lemnae]|uniref:Uncharacterized protein n=1 Tax=Stylonychia lemnae TaxID=5949 RepID=A0A078B8E7_STYLE|nr:UNKNOWN [Stylonychia lemnae]|eukprot:CDW89567.1 UNKNOWN [Stylonychia lemnae]
MRIDFQGSVDKTCYFDNLSLFKRPMISAMSIDQSKGDIYLLIHLSDQQGNLYAIKNDLSYINQIYRVNKQYTFFCSVYYYLQQNKAFVMGVWMPPTTDNFGIFIAILYNDLGSTYTQFAFQANELKQY